MTPSQDARAAQATAPAARQSRTRHLSLVSAWALVVLLLLGLGAATESGWIGRRPRRFRADP